MKTYKIHLIRNGLTEANERGLYCGSTDLPLSREGASQLARLLDECDYPYAETVFTSPLARAVETAELLYPDCPLREVWDLRETSFGVFEGRSLNELKDDPDFQRWAAPAGDFVPEGAEKPVDFVRRSCSAIVDIVNTMMREHISAAAVVTHAGVIANVLACLAYPRRTPFEWNCEPGCGYTAMADITLFMREPVLEVTALVPTEVYGGEEDE